jgi:nucleotide-binding universal stress UspA family protein
MQFAISSCRDGEEVTMNEQPILICYDDSHDSQHAIHVAAQLFPHRRAVVLDVAPPLTFGESIGASTGVAPDFAEVNVADARSLAEIGARLARDAGLPAQARTVVRAPIWEGVVEVSEEVDALAIVIGSHGAKRGRALFEGSLSHDVAVHSRKPVLIVPPQHGPS